VNRARFLAVGLIGGALAVVGGARAARAPDHFDHWQHRAVFPSCLGCHAGITDSARSVWPSPANCQACHDGTVERTVNWRAPDRPRPSNLRFTHPKHAQLVAKTEGDSVLPCRACHIAPGTDPMQVRRAVVPNCFTCHGVRGSHFDAPDTACATCHLPLAQAALLSSAAIHDFPAPASHREPGFAAGQHGKLARAARPIAPSCATCHAQDFCAQCHVNAPEVPAIQALARDPRSLSVRAKLEKPASHSDPAFLREHGQQMRKRAASCATCHTQESCLTCHVGSPASVTAIPAAAPGRGKGAQVRRRRPGSHGLDFSKTHAAIASARPQTCAACHARPACLECHRPSAADPPPGYHPAGFLTTHPVAAYSRESSCSECHNQAQFCTNCHLNAGLVPAGQLRGLGFHDAKQAFLLNHGQAARQSLESCVSCHAERDCLTCHSAVGGRRFNPHGPGFDPATLRRKNSQVCTVCHGAAIPE
jgi:Doubled CXXCH motif (Paired_CXXCH_1)